MSQERSSRTRNMNRNLNTNVEPGTGNQERRPRRERGATNAALIAAARKARRYAHAQFSNFKVGAALETADGTIVTGCNIENATYGLTICAERVAMFKALSDGHTKFRRVAVVADTDEATPPPGGCRRLLWGVWGGPRGVA